MIGKLISIPCRILRDATGTTAVEFALFAPLMLTLFCGAYEVSDVAIVNMKLSAAASTVSDLTAQQSVLHSSDIDSLFAAAQLVMTPSPTSSLGIAVASVTFDASTGAASVAWQQTRGTATAMTDAASSATGLGDKGDTVIVAQVVYTYSSLLKYVLPRAVTYKQRVYTRPRLVTSIPYS
jgi:Flp pilus assembly protein TadG